MRFGCPVLLECSLVIYSGGVNCCFACIFYRNPELNGPQFFFDFMGSKVVGDFRCESSEYVAYCYWADAAIFFPKGSRIG